MERNMKRENFMKRAIEHAKAAAKHGDVPVGAVLVRDGKLIAWGENRREADADPCAHAELLAIRMAAQSLSDWRLDGTQLYVTLEPCPMCAGAIALCRISEVYFGAYDGEAGCCGSLYNLPADARLGTSTKVFGGLLHEECAALITDFFKALRTKTKVY